MHDMSISPGQAPRPVLMVRPEDHRRTQALRQMAMTYADLPRYLLLPEVSALLHYLSDWTQTRLGFNVVVLALKRRDFRLNGDYPHIVIRTAKQHRAGPDRPAKGKSANRVVPLSDPGFVDELRRLFASTRERIETDLLVLIFKRKYPIPFKNVVKLVSLNNCYSLNNRYSMFIIYILLNIASLVNDETAQTFSMSKLFVTCI